MNRPELFVKSVDILVDAFNKGKLQNMSVCNCAVGNLVAYRRGNYLFESDSSDTWHSLISDMRDRKKIGKNLNADVKTINKEVYNGNVTSADIKYGLKEIRSTEYSIDEVELIERAFENLDRNGDHVGKAGEVKSGLLRSVGVLGKIHQIPSDTVKCMKDHIRKGTYKFSYKFKESDSYYGDCPVVKPLK